MTGVDPWCARLTHLAFGIVLLGLGLASNVTESPVDLQFKSPEAHFPGCTGCLFAERNKAFNIECHFSGRTGNVVGKISVGSRILTPGPLLSGSFSAEYRVGEKDHLADVRCRVDTLTSFVTQITKKLYVLVRPQPPELTGTTVKKGKPTLIVCSTMGARPPAKLSIFIGENETDAEQSDSGYRGSLGSTVYHSRVELRNFKTIWKQKPILCCVAHETLEAPLCSPMDTVNYLFPPSKVEINYAIVTDDPRSFYFIFCGVINANPACGAEINVTEERRVNSSTSHHTENTDSGTTTILTVVIEVAGDMGGETIVCSVNCLEFDVEVTDSLILPAKGLSGNALSGIVFSSVIGGMALLCLFIVGLVECIKYINRSRATVSAPATASSVNSQPPSNTGGSLTPKNVATPADTNTMSDEV